MTRAPKRGRALRPTRSQGRIGYIFLAVFLVLVAVVLVWIVPRLLRLKTAIDDFTGSVIATRPPELTPGATPQPTPAVPREPTNILLIGVDKREGVAGTRNDVNIVVHINPVHRFASMLSIPRDTRVLIPGFDYSKINNAYSLGEQYMSDAGGGPVLVKRTVERFLDLPIHYWAEVDFQGFERVVDMVDGVTVDVPVPLVDNEYPTEDYGYTRIYFPAGLQHMDGPKALQYARSRHADSDIGRNQRQQQVLMALRDRVVRLETLFDLDRLTELLYQLGDTLRTDMQLDTIWALAQLAPKIDSNNIASYALDWHVLAEISGTTDLDPCVPCVREIVQEMQINPTLRQLRGEGARVEVRNGTWSCTGCAARTAEYLRQRGFTIVDVLQDEFAGAYTYTVVLGGEQHPFTRGLMVELFSIRPDSLYPDAPDPAKADIVLILGDDYKPPEE